MIQYVGSILEFHLEPDGRRSTLISCPDKAVPKPGQYVMTSAPSDPESLLATPLFLQRRVEKGFLAAPIDRPLSPFWQLGTELILRGPLGKGFHTSPALRNLALVAVGNSAARLLPLLGAAENIAFFTDLPVQDLPVHVEAQPLSAAVEALNWADFTAVDVPLLKVNTLPSHIPIAGAVGEVLVTTEMPCGGLADCSVCALTSHRKPTLLCMDGPVISFQKLNALIR